MCRWLRLAPLVMTTGLGLVAAGSAQETVGENPPLVIPSMYGRDLFGFYCAPCHGRDGKGGGPVAEALKSRPSDLTAIARHSGGRFSRARVEGFVTHGSGGAATAHGTPEMPVWGPTFRSLDPSDARVKVRTSNLVDYIESIQTR